MPEHQHAVAVRAYLDNAGITPETLRYAATHEALCRSWIFDLLTGLADLIELRESLARGLEDSAAGRTHDLGDFSQYAEPSPAPTPNADETGASA